MLRLPHTSTLFPYTTLFRSLGEGTGALAGDVHEPGIAGDLVKHRQHPLRFRQKAAVQIRFELQQSVVDSQAVVFHAPGNTTDRKSTRLNSSHITISYAVFCL